MSCIDEDAALAFVQGDEVPAAVKDHVAGCEVCRAFVAGLARVMIPDATASFGGWGAVAVGGGTARSRPLSSPKVPR